jgi:protein phosphatase
MATTCTGIIIRKDEASVCHVGDSRLYRIRNGEICQLTEDHTVARRLYRQGTIGAGDIENHPYNHVLTDALGVRQKPRIDLLQCKVRKKDAFLLCSDGLTKYLSSEELRDTAGNLSAEEAAERLVALAKDRGGDDNISVVIVKIGDEPPDGSTARISMELMTGPSGKARSSGKRILVAAVCILALAAIGFVCFNIRYAG